MQLSSFANKQIKITIPGLFAVVISLIASVWILIDFDKPAYYSMLFLLPLSFSVSSICFRSLYKKAMENLGVMIILIFFFVKTVLSPLLMSIGGYSQMMFIHIEENTLYAILLMVYEVFTVFFFLTYFSQTPLPEQSVLYEKKPNITQLYKMWLLFALVVFFACICLAPEILTSKRSIFQMNEQFFSNYEDTVTIEKYSGSFVTKFAAVTGNYMMKIMTVLLPAYLIIKIARKQTRFRKKLAFLVSLTPLLFVGGAIARSLIYVVSLLFLINYMFHIHNFRKKSFWLLGMGGIFVIVYWLLTADSENIMGQLAGRFNSYFSGVNIVAGTFNLPENFSYRLKYLFQDFFRTIPYGNTIFNFSGDTVQQFFNNYNNTHGQIPPSIGMGCYYLGPLFAPVFSILFARISYLSGEQLRKNQSGNPFGCLRHILTVFYVSMGICMYNIEITMTNIYSVLLPMYILERFSYKKVK